MSLDLKGVNLAKVIPAVVSAVQFLAKLRDAGVPATLAEEATALAANLTTSALPPPPDGVAWTDADLAALYAEHVALTDDIAARHSAGPTGEP